MRLTRALLTVLCVLTLAAPLAAQDKKKRLLVIGQTKGFQHDSTTAGMATMWKLGQESGLWETYIRTDCQLITKKKLGGNARNLDYFDAIFFMTTGELEMDDSQKADLISFVKDEGKGFIGAHCANDTFYQWPEFGELIGGYFDGHPWGTTASPMVVEDPANPIVRHLPREFSVVDEIYQARDFSRERVRVLMRMDESKLDMTKKGIKRADKDFAVTWIRHYGKGRVFYSSFGHTNEMWARPDIQKMWIEAFKWVAKMTEADAAPRPRP